MVFSSHIQSHTFVWNDMWIIDTKAIDHMVHSLSFLTSVTSSINASVELPNENLAPVTDTSTIQFSSSLILKREETKSSNNSLKP
jgi:hypothetical protein